MSWRLSAPTVTKAPNIPGINGPDSSLPAQGSFDGNSGRSASNMLKLERIAYTGLDTAFVAVSCDGQTKQSHTRGRYRSR